MCACVCLRTCLYARLCMCEWTSVCVLVCVGVRVRECVCVRLCVTVCVCLCASVCALVCLSAFPAVEKGFIQSSRTVHPILCSSLLSVWNKTTQYHRDP